MKKTHWDGDDYNDDYNDGERTKWGNWSITLNLILNKYNEYNELKNVLNIQIYKHSMLLK